jgi:hypothetical protein
VVSRDAWIVALLEVQGDIESDIGRDEPAADWTWIVEVAD